LRREHTGKAQGGNLPQGEARRHVRPHTGLLQGFGRGQVHAVEAGLGVLGDGKLLYGSGKALLAGAGAELVRHIEHGPGGGAHLTEGLAHAAVLGALPSEHKGYLTHLPAPFSTSSASWNISWMISAAGCSLLIMPEICPARKSPVF